MTLTTKEPYWYLVIEPRNSNRDPQESDLFLNDREEVYITEQISNFIYEPLLSNKSLDLVVDFVDHLEQLDEYYDDHSPSCCPVPSSRFLSYGGHFNSGADYFEQIMEPFSEDNIRDVGLPIPLIFPRKLSFVHTIIQQLVRTAYSKHSNLIHVNYGLQIMADHQHKNRH